MHRPATMLIGLCLAADLSIAQQPNIFKNGGFESGMMCYSTSIWSETGQAFTGDYRFQLSTDAHSGAYSIEISCSGSDCPKAAVNSDTIQTPPGQAYQLNAWTKCPAGQSAAAYIPGTAGGDTYAPWSCTGDWAQNTLNFAAGTADNFNISFYIYGGSSLLLDDVVLTYADGTVPQQPILHPGTRNVQISGQTVMVDGAPYFAKGFFNVEYDNLPLAAATGANTLQSVGSTIGGSCFSTWKEDYLDRAYDLGMNFAPDAADTARLDLPSLFPSIVSQFAPHMANIMWSQADEPDQALYPPWYIPPATFLAEYGAAKSTLSLPIIANFQRPSWSVVSATAPYVGSVDVWMAEPYGSDFNGINNAVNIFNTLSPQPIWLSQDDPGASYIVPKAYWAVIYGATGIMYFTWDAFQADPAALAAVTQAFGELNQLNSVIFAPNVSSQVTPPAGIGATARSLNGTTYVLSANPTTSPVQGEFLVNGLQAGTQINVLFENRSITAEAGGFVDSFSTVARHVYAIPGPPVPMTVTSTPAGIPITVDGTSCVTPCNLQWSPGSTHNVAAQTQAGATGTQYAFSAWSDGGAASHAILAPASASTFTASFVTQYYLTTAASPANGGVVSPSSGWFNAGTPVSVSATDANGYQFSAFSGALSGAVTPVGLTLTNPATVTGNFAAITSQPGWFDVFTNRRKLTIAHTKIAGALTNFPILISLTDSELMSVSNGGKVQSASGYDLLFTAGDGVTQLPHEIEAYNGSTGTLVAWVQVPSLSPSADTPIYLYYGKPASTDEENAVNVWDSAYRVVQHFKPGAPDSTQYQNSMIPYGDASVTPSGVAGTAYYVDGVTGQLSVPYNTSWNGPFSSYTVEFWIKPGVLPDYSGALAIGGWSSAFNVWFLGNGNTSLRMDTAGGYCANGGAVPLDNAFHQVVMSYDSSISQLNAYVDGVPNTFPAVCTGNLAPPQGDLLVGRFENGTQVQATFDELRISAGTPRSSAWITTGFNSQSSPSTFYSVGSSESISNPTPVTTITTTVTSNPAGLALTVDGAACTAPCVFQWPTASNHTISAAPQAGSTGTQFVFSSWSDAGAASHTVTASASLAALTATFGTQYYLSTAAGAGGTISPASEWVNSGTAVTVTAAANTGFTFTGFSGSLTGTIASQILTVTAPASVTASFAVFIPIPVVTEPMFSVTAGTYTSAQSVSISTTTAGASIRYTTNGTPPSETVGAVYNGPVTVSSTGTLIAVAYETGYTDSTLASASYTINLPTVPNGPSGPGWYNNAWASRKAISMSSGQVSGALTNFPMLYSVTDVDLVGNAQVSGNDILFTASDGVTKLNHEIESYNSGTGTLVAWVQVPVMQPGAVIYLYYGNAAASDQQSQRATWDSNYQMVWHLNGGSTAPDSTGNGDNGTALFNSPGGTAGKIGGGTQFQGAAFENFRTPAMTIGAAGTVEFWVNPADYNAPSDQVFANLFGTGTGLYIAKGMGFYGFSLNTPSYSYANSMGNSPNVSTIAVGSWTHVVYAWDDSTQSYSAYVNGVLQSTNAGNPSPHMGISTTFDIGGSFGNAGFTNSSMDEVRYSNIARSAEWVGAEYNNENSPSTFYSVGSVQTNGSTPSPIAITVASSPSGMSLTVDNAACTAPCGFQWTTGSTHTIAVTTSPQAGSVGTQYVYASWSDHLAQSHTITVPAAAAAYTAIFTPQYYLTTTATTGGNINPASEWVNGGTGVMVTAAANTGFTFTGFSGNLTGASVGATGSQILTMSAPAAVTANFAPVAPPPAVMAPTFSVTAGTYTSAQSVWIGTTTAGASIRYTTNGTPPSETVGTLYNGSVTVNSSETLMAIAYETGYTDSSVNSSAYTINLPVTSGGSEAGWFSNAWGHRKAISINSGQVSGALTNFPMLYSVTDVDLVGNAQVSGNDILFTASDGVTKLNHEIESYNSGTGTLVAWVQVPVMQPGAVIYLYYGNAAASDQQSQRATWDSNYQMVWHLNGGSTAPDSTGNGDNGTALFNSPGATAGKIGGGTQFQGAAFENFRTPAMTIGAAGTVEFWVNPADYNAPSDQVFANLFGTGTGLYIAKGMGFYGFSLNTPSYSYANSMGNSPNVSTIAVGSWTHVVYAWDDSTQSYSAYVNGVLQSTNAGYPSPHTAASITFDIGGSFGNAGFTNSSMDEVRYSNIARSAEWVGAEYNNENSPSTFYSVGSVQTNGSTPSPIAITVASSPSGMSLTVDNAACTAPCGFQWTTGSTHTIAVTTSPQAGSVGTQYVYASWSDHLAQSHTITVPAAAAAYTAIFTPQYYLTTTATTGGNINPASEWVNGGTGVMVTAAANTGFTFTGFSGNLTGASVGATGSQILTMSAPAAVTANFAPVAPPPAVMAPTFSVTAGTYTSAQSVWIGTTTAGASIRYTTNGTPPSETVGTLYNGSVTVNSSETLMAIAYETGYTDSSVNSSAYTINLPVTSGGSEAGWFSNAWGHRKAISINSGQVSGALTNFPMLYSVTDVDLVGNAQVSGNDILFTASDGVTKLNHEIESYNSGTGTLVAWVQVPVMQPGAVIYLYYGNAAASDQQSQRATWDSNYQMVWHLNGGSTAPDSTGNGDNGTALFNSPGGTAGKIGGGTQFQGAAFENFRTPAMTIGAAGTVEFWVNPADYNAPSDQVFANLFGTGTGLYIAKGMGFYGFSLNTPSYSYANYMGNSPNVSTIAVGSWTHVVYAWDDSTQSYSAYVNGVLQSTNAGYPSPHMGISTTFDIGGSFGNAGFTNSSMDEVRYSNIARSAAWVGAEYNNENSPSTFYSVGAQQ